MATSPPRNLRELVKASSVQDALGWDSLVGLICGVAAAWRSWTHFDSLVGASNTAAQIVGAVLGLAIGAPALVAAFMDQELLRKLEAIERQPIRYITPFILTAAIGVFAAIGLVVLTLVPPTAPPGVRAALGGVVFGLSGWTFVSVLRCLSSLVGFVALKSTAAKVDPVDVAEFRRPNCSGGGR